MPVYKKLHKLQAATRSLSANAEGQTGSARYSYVSGAKLLGTIRPKMDELGLILTQEVLDDTDVLLWWAHIAHERVPDEVVARVKDAVRVTLSPSP